jgi:hypothetical protein
LRVLDGGSAMAGQRLRRFVGLHCVTVAWRSHGAAPAAAPRMKPMILATAS